jgi:endo-1,4-beta-mannosidase
VKRKHLAVAETIRHQAKMHGYHLTEAEALDIAAQALMVALADEPRTSADAERMWRPADAHECGEYAHGWVMDGGVR